MFTVYRVEKSGEKCVIAWVDDAIEIGTVIDEDRKKTDSEPAYEVVKE